MGKVLAIGGMVVSVCLVVLFGMDLAAEFPFQRISMAMDIGFIVAGVILGYISLATLRELP